LFVGKTRKKNAIQAFAFAVVTFFTGYMVTARQETDDCAGVL